mmetsp:Transcript_95302/g.226994  ORF Transcript_95302/g.226994 Transcript_95302/m.226994 type:complete len:205 (+) Transcript_95302:773-1387(+)
MQSFARRLSGKSWRSLGSSGSVVSKATFHDEEGSGTWKTFRMPDSLSMDITKRCSLKVKDLYLADGCDEEAAFVWRTGHFSTGLWTSAAQTRVSPDSRWRRRTKSSPRSPHRKGVTFQSPLNLPTSGQGCHLSSRPRRLVASMTFSLLSSGGLPSSASRIFLRTSSTGASTAGSGAGPICGGWCIRCGGGGPYGCGIIGARPSK